jgi:hypothetical protein
LKIPAFIVLLFVTNYLPAQKVDSIAFHLYTDSLKKGTHNYINVDGKLDNGKWRPLSSKEISFSSTAGTFEGNDLVLSENFKPEWVEITASLRSNAAQIIKTRVWIKKIPDPDRLPTVDEIMNKKPDSTKRSKRNKN